MNKILKTVISAALIFAVVTGLCLPAFASAEKTAFVTVSGMNTFPLYDEDGTKVYPPSTKNILALVADILPDVIRYLVTKDADKLADTVLPAAYKLFEPVACTKSGDSKYPLHTDTFGSLTEHVELFEGYDKDEEGVVHAAIDRYGAENVFFFNYDWRLDPLCHADDLNKFIQQVKKQTGCRRVVLAAFSMGGTVVNAYLYKYGSSDIKTLELCSTAFQGTSAVGELFRGDIDINVEALFRRLAQLTRNGAFEQILFYLNEGLTKNGFNGGLTDFAKELVAGVGDRLYTELFIPVFGYMPGLWALCNYDNFKSCKKYMIRGNDCGALVKRITAYHNIQGSAEYLLRRAMKNTNVYIFAQYGMQGLPVSPLGNTGNSDNLIDTVYESGGAVCSPLGETLGENYVQKKHRDRNYLSEDCQIDSSTCMLPDKTWFIANMGHVDYPYGAGTDFILYFAEQNNQKTVMNADYTQFMSYDYQKDALSPVTAEKKETVLTKILGSMSGIRNGYYDCVESVKDIFR